MNNLDGLSFSTSSLNFLHVCMYSVCVELTNVGFCVLMYSAVSVENNHIVKVGGVWLRSFNGTRASFKM